MGKKKRTDYKCSFKGVQIEPPAFGKLLALNGLAWTNRKNLNGAFVWGFKDGHIVATSDPLTGNNAAGKKVGIGIAEDIGIEGTKSFRDRVAKFFKRNAQFDYYNGSQRRFV